MLHFKLQEVNTDFHANHGAATMVLICKDVFVGDEIFDLYSNAAQVGPGSINNPKDCSLVQHLFQILYHEKTPSGWAIRGNVGMPKKYHLKPITNVTGTCGPITKAWINAFQDNIKKLKGNIRVDGFVDPCTSSIGMSSISKTMYTIAFLNYYCARDFSVEHASMATHPNTPPEVKAALASADVITVLRD